MKNKTLAGGVQARFTPDAFSQLINAHGLTYWWSRALVCPCSLNPDTGQWDPACTRCLDGFLYINPCYNAEQHLTRRYSKIEAIFSSITFDQTRHEFIASPWTTGVGTMTVDGHFSVGYRDRFVAKDQRTTFSQVLERGIGNPVKVGWIGRNTAAKTQAMRYEPIAVHYVEDEDEVVYLRGTDFTILGAIADEPKRMNWGHGRGPAVGKTFTIVYDCHPVWVVDDATFGVQNSIGPAGGISGADAVQYLPITFRVVLDWLTEKQGA